MQIAKKTENSVIVKFIERRGRTRSTFIWPNGVNANHLHTHPLDDVICCLHPPTLKMGKTGRSLLYVFSQEDMEKVAKCAAAEITIQ